MKLEQSFVVAQPLEAVWAALTDLRTVAGCLPGARVDAVDPDGTHHGSLTVRLGSISASFTGTARFLVVDRDARHVELEAGGTSSQGDVRLGLVGDASQTAGGTAVRLTTDVELTGRLAQLGHGVGARVTERLVERLAGTLQARLAGEEVDESDAADTLAVSELLRGALPPEAAVALRLAGLWGAGAVLGWLVRTLVERTVAERGGERRVPDRRVVRARGLTRR